MFRLFNKLERKVISLALVSAIGAGVIAFLSSSKETKIQEIPKLTPTTWKISDLLAKKGLRPLSRDNKDRKLWLNNWQNFQKKFKDEAPKNFWKFSDWESFKDDAKVPNKFKTKCETNVKREVDSDKRGLFKDVIAYCAGKISDGSEAKIKK